MARSDSTLSTTEEYWPTMYDEWLSWSGEETRSEWVDGEVVVFMPPSIRHARLAHFRLGLLDPVVLYFGLGEVFVEPVEMRLRAGRSFRLPDILFVAREHLHRLSAMRLEGPVDLVVKLLSEESQQRERIEKTAEYAEGGIPENWAIDAWSDSQYAAFYQLGPDHRYHPMPLDGAGRYHSKVLPQFWPCPDWLWRDPLPQPMDCLAEIEPEVLKRWPMGDSAREVDERCSTE